MLRNDLALPQGLNLVSRETATRHMLCQCRSLQGGMNACPAGHLRGLFLTQPAPYSSASAAEMAALPNETSLGSFMFVP